MSLSCCRGLAAAAAAFQVAISSREVATAGERDSRRVDWPFVGGIGYTPLSLRGPVAQLGARLNGIQEVTGSIPVRSTILRSRELTPKRELRLGKPAKDAAP